MERTSRRNHKTHNPSRSLTLKNTERRFKGHLSLGGIRSSCYAGDRELKEQQLHLILSMKICVL